MKQSVRGVISAAKSQLVAEKSCVKPLPGQEDDIRAWQRGPCDIYYCPRSCPRGHSSAVRAEGWRPGGVRTKCDVTPSKGRGPWRWGRKTWLGPTQRKQWKTQAEKKVCQTPKHGLTSHVHETHHLLRQVWNHPLIRILSFSPTDFLPRPFREESRERWFPHIISGPLHVLDFQSPCVSHQSDEEKWPHGWRAFSGNPTVTL